MPDRLKSLNWEGGEKEDIEPKKGCFQYFKGYKNDVGEGKETQNGYQGIFEYRRYSWIQKVQLNTEGIVGYRR